MPESNSVIMIPDDDDGDDYVWFSLIDPLFRQFVTICHWCGISQSISSLSIIVFCAFHSFFCYLCRTLILVRIIICSEWSKKQWQCLLIACQKNLAQRKLFYKLWSASTQPNGNLYQSLVILSCLCNAFLRQIRLCGLWNHCHLERPIILSSYVTATEWY